MASDVWPLVHTERAALADDLAHLTREQWATPSLCEGWSVHELLAHQVSTAKTTVGGFFGGIVRSGFSFDRFAARGVADEVGSGPEATLAEFRSVQEWTQAPPGPKDSWLGEALIHGEDTRRPLGIVRHYPVGAVVRTLEFYKGSNLVVGTKKRIAGVTLSATDTSWTHGSGPMVEGPAMALLMVATGRKAFLDDVRGPGVEVLRSR